MLRLIPICQILKLRFNRIDSRGYFYTRSDCTERNPATAASRAVTFMVIIKTSFTGFGRKPQRGPGVLLGSADQIAVAGVAVRVD